MTKDTGDLTHNLTTKKSMIDSYEIMFSVDG